MNRTRASELLAKFPEQRLLVVGDVILDKFVWGEVNRFSPEAHTCPVLDHTGQTTMLGGAGNVATNLNALGSSCVSLVGTIGGDPEADELSWMTDFFESLIDPLQSRPALSLRVPICCDMIVK